MKKALLILICIYAFFIPLEYLYVELFNFDSELKPYRVMALIIVVFTMFSMKKIKFHLDKYDILFLILFSYGFGLAVIFWILGYGNIYYAINDIQLILIGFIISIIIKNMNFNTNEIKRIFLFFFIAVFFNAIYIFYQAFILFDFMRISGFFKNPNQAGGVITMGIIYMFYIFSIYTNKYMKIMIIISVILLFFALILTGSRAALLGLLISGLILFFMNSKRKLLKITLMGMFIYTISIGYAYLMNSSELTRLSDRFNPENIQGGAGRTDIWKSAGLLSSDNLLVGVGMSEYRSYHHKYIRKVDNVESLTVLNFDLGPHSDYVSMLVEYGIIGVFIYFSIWLFLFLDIKKNMKSNGMKNRFSLFIFFILVQIFLQGFFQVSYMLPYYWLILSLSISYFKFNLKERKNVVY